MFDYIKKENGGNPDISFEELTRRFNARFPNRPQRLVSGIRTLVERLRQQYRQYNGQMKPKTGKKRKRDDEDATGLDGTNDLKPEESEEESDMGQYEFED